MHVFCESCLTSWLKRTKEHNCPECRKKISQQVKCPTLLTALDRIYNFIGAIEKAPERAANELDRLTEDLVDVRK